ncbi:MAG: hypothetical protein WDZ49_17295 [Litorilinea sp.]
MAEANLRLSEMTLITAADGRDMLGQLTPLGVETINDRSALRFQGNKDVIPVVGTASDTLDVSRTDSAQINLWVDTEFNVISRLLLEATVGEGDEAMHMSVMIEYYDFNTDITITAPDVADADAGGESGDEPVAEADLRGPVSQLLGFNLLLPSGSNVETVAGDAMVVATTPYTFDEAQNWLELNLVQGGYAQTTKIGPANDQVTYIFQNDVQSVSIIVAPDGAGGTRIQWVVTP